MFKANKLIVIFTFLFLFSLSANFSFASIGNGQDNLNFTFIEVSPPYNVYTSDFLGKPEAWEKVSSQSSLMSAYVQTDKISIQAVSDYDTIETKSIADIAAMFNSSLYTENAEYAYAHIAVPNENYESLTKVLKALGFEVNNFTLDQPLLNDSVNSIGLPFTYTSDSGQTSTLTGAGTTIAIIDTGIDSTFSDFNGRLKFWNDTSGEGLTSYYDYDGHGTHVASIAAGSGFASNGKYKGVAPEANLKVWKICRYANWCDPYSDCYYSGCDEDAMASAVSQAVAQNVDVISMSLGTIDLPTANDCNGVAGFGSSMARMNLFNAIQDALNHNISVVASAGNLGTKGIIFPACIKNVIAVGATVKKDYPDNFYGRLVNDSDADYREKINLSAQVSVNGVISKNFVGEIERENPDKRKGKSSFQFTLQSNAQTSNVHLNLETEHKDRACYISASTWWDPGSKISGDSFFQFDNTSSGSYLGVELITNPYYVDGGAFSCPFDGVAWYNIGLPFICSGTAKTCSSFTDAGNKDSDGRLKGDVNGDCVVNQTDLDLCAAHYGENWPSCDWDKDGIVGLGDTETVSLNMGKVCGCENQEGCDWCGCDEVVGTSLVCNKDILQSDCTGGGKTWVGCEGTAKSCADRTKWPYQCGTPSTTGCNGTWGADGIYFNVFSKRTPGTKDFVAYYSGRGPSPNNLIKPEVTAPGDLICAAKSSEIDPGKDSVHGFSICDNSNYFALSGTSMATPHVAGLVALLKQANPNASVSDIRNAIINTAQPAGYGSNVEGFGRINATNAIKAICDLKDGWYNTTTQWISNGQCTEKEQVQQEYRNYSCPAAQCTYTLINYQWVDTGNIRNKQDGTTCDDGLFCTVNDQCSSGVCSGAARNCADYYSCTDDSCDEVNERCVNAPNNNKCTSPQVCNPLLFQSPTGCGYSTNPIITIISPASPYHKINIPLNFTINRPTTIWIGYSLDGQANKTITGNTSLNSSTGLTDGNHNLIVYAKDSSGNVGTSGKVYFSYCLADINNDGIVGLSELGILAKAYGSHGPDYHYIGELVSQNWNPNADINNDGTVNLSDLGILAKNYNNRCW